MIKQLPKAGLESSSGYEVVAWTALNWWLGMLEEVGEVFPEAKYQRCTVHFHRNIFSATPCSKVKLLQDAQGAPCPGEHESRRKKAKAVGEELCSMKLKEDTKNNGIEENLTHCNFPSEHWTRLHINNVIKRLN